MAEGWRPRGWFAWVLTIAACLLLAIVALAAFYMLVPIDFDGLGFLGVVLLVFPLHLVVAAALSAGFAGLAWRCHARLPTAVFVVVAALTTVMALAPSVALWRRAGELGVPISLADYLENALRPNDGEPQPDRTVTYRPATDGVPVMLDVWRTGKAGPSLPAIVRIHGGGWVTGSRGAMARWNRWLNGLGYDVFDIDYRMPPHADWRDEVGDVKCALGWVALHAAEYGLDPARISVMGSSAGGNLAMMAAYDRGDPELPPSCDGPLVAVRSVINLYGPVDLTLIQQSGSLAYVEDSLRRYIGGTAAQYPERYRALSPINHIDATTAPTITVLGTSDRIISLDQAEVLDQALTRAGIAHETVLLPATDHGFDFNWGAFGTQIARARIESFLRRYDSP
jgi:acetyl esterase/lipase